MKLPNWFRIFWWALLLVGIGCILYMRLPDLASGKAVIADALIFLIWVALFLSPLFQEMSFWGISFSQQVKDLKDEVTGLRNDIRNSVDVRTQINPTFHIPSPPPDSQLPALEERLRNILQDVLRNHGIERTEVRPGDLDLPDNVVYLFKARYQIERELRRIWRNRMHGDEPRRQFPVFQIAQALASEGLIDQRLASVIREVYSVASPAIHGEPVTDAKIAFVRDVAPELIAALKAIE